MWKNKTLTMRFFIILIRNSTSRVGKKIFIETISCLKFLKSEHKLKREIKFLLSQYNSQPTRNKSRAHSQLMELDLLW